VLFKCNMDDIKKANNDTYVMLTNVYARLKNLIYEDIPKITWEKKFDMPNPLPHDQLLHLSPESFNKLKPNQDIRNNVNEWVEDTLFHVILRKKFDHSDKEKHLLYLYRLLAIKYRVTYPLKGESFTLDEDLRIVLESKVCDAALAYFDTPSAHDQIIYPKIKHTATKSAVPAAKQNVDRSKSTGSKKPSTKPVSTQLKKGTQLNSVAKALGVHLGKVSNSTNSTKVDSRVVHSIMGPMSSAGRAELAQDYQTLIELISTLNEVMTDSNYKSEAVKIMEMYYSKIDPDRVPTSKSELLEDVQTLGQAIGRIICHIETEPIESEYYERARQGIASLLCKAEGQGGEMTEDGSAADRILRACIHETN
jgi:hypothetical protein